MNPEHLALIPPEREAEATPSGIAGAAQRQAAAPFPHC